MTTEVAVINRIGVALATDSAVTISGNGKIKTFDTADKLFELDCNRPVGIMINGNMDFLGIPWEILIKDFRAKKSHTNTITDTLQEFIDFTSERIERSGKNEESFVTDFAIEELEKLVLLVSRHRMTLESSADGDIVKTIVDFAKRRKEHLSQYPTLKSLEGLEEGTISKKHRVAINASIDHVLGEIELDTRSKAIVRGMVITALLKAKPSDVSTGLVVAGYAGDDMFPAISIAEVDGSVCGRIRYVHGQHVKIHRRGNPGRVISFAQTDVADRLLSGADAQFVEASAEFIRMSLTSMEQSFAQLATGMPAAAVTELVQKIASFMENGYVNTFAPSTRDQFQRSFDEMVAMMPKQEIIELAEALVSITAIERKASSDQATVGGPVDVAFITKHEGFVWIRRKHYFEPSLNPRYLSKKFGQVTMEVSDELLQPRGRSQERPTRRGTAK